MAMLTAPLVTMVTMVTAVSMAVDVNSVCDSNISGLFVFMPCLDEIRVVDMRTVSFNVAPQEVCNNHGDRVTMVTMVTVTMVTMETGGSRYTLFGVCNGCPYIFYIWFNKRYP